jgi:hypothetical protein
VSFLRTGEVGEGTRGYSTERVGARVGHGGEAFQVGLSTGCISMAGQALYVWDVLPRYEIGCR